MAGTPSIYRLSTLISRKPTPSGPQEPRGTRRSRSGLSLTPTCAPSGASPGGFPRGGFPLGSLLSSLPLGSLLSSLPLSSLLSSLPLDSLPCGLPLDSLPCSLPLSSLPCGLSSRRFTFTRCFLFLRWCHANETSTDAVGYS